MTVCLLQDHLYVQYVELNQFQNEFRELANKFGENEKIIKKKGILDNCRKFRLDSGWDPF